MRTDVCIAGLAAGVHAVRKKDYQMNFELFLFLAFIGGYIAIKGVIEAFAILRCFDWLREFGYSKEDEE